LELNPNKDETYLGERKPKEEAVEGPIGLVLPEFEHETDRQWDGRIWEERLGENWGAGKMRKMRYGGLFLTEKLKGISHNS